MPLMPKIRLSRHRRILEPQSAQLPRCCMAPHMYWLKNRRVVRGHTPEQLHTNRFRHRLRFALSKWTQSLRNSSSCHQHNLEPKSHTFQKGPRPDKTQYPIPPDSVCHLNRIDLRNSLRRVHPPSRYTTAGKRLGCINALACSHWYIGRGLPVLSFRSHNMQSRQTLDSSSAP